MIVVDAGAAGFVSVRAWIVVGGVATIAALWLPLRRWLGIAFSATLFTALAVGAFSFAADAVDRSTSYRPFELLQTNDPACRCRHYKPETTLDGFAMPYGDLIPLGRMQRLAVDVSPREVTYRTDNLGLRNDHPYRGERVILVGDSFAAGDDNDQADTPSAQLLAAQVPAYDVAFSGDPTDYARLFNYFWSHAAPRPARPDVVVLLYEGNDFDTSADAGPDTIGARIRAARARLTKTAYYRFTFSLWNRLWYDLSPARDHRNSGVIIRTIGSHRVGFLDSYVQRTRAADEDVSADASALARVFAEFKGRLTRVFLVPTKYRVYYPTLEPAAPPLPRRAWRITEAACAMARIACDDLSPMLTSAAREALDAHDALLYWPDDTHWNRRGIEAAVAAMARRLRPE